MVECHRRSARDDHRPHVRVAVAKDPSEPLEIRRFEELVAVMDLVDEP